MIGDSLFWVEWQSALAYPEDAVVLLCSPQDYTNHVEQALSLSQDARATPGLSECSFTTQSLHN